VVHISELAICKLKHGRGDSVRYDTKFDLGDCVHATGDALGVLPGNEAPVDGIVISCSIMHGDPRDESLFAIHYIIRVLGAGEKLVCVAEDGLSAA